MSLTEEIRQMKVGEKLMLSEEVGFEDAKQRKNKSPGRLHPLFSRIEGTFKTRSQLTFVGEELWLLIVIRRTA